MELNFELLKTEALDNHIYRGQTVDIGAPQLYGGLVMGQAVYAASQTVPRDRAIHSMHCYFILRGDPYAPIIYQIDPIREGNSFSTRRIVALQHGKAIFNMSASFQIKESGISHQLDHEPVKGPEGLLNLKQINSEAAERSEGVLRDRLKSWAQTKWPIEIRPIDAYDPLNPVKAPPKSGIWFRILNDISLQSLAFRQASLACLSDYMLLSTALIPHGISWLKGVRQAASLDHSMWFHEPFHGSSWMLYLMDSPKTGNSRGLTRGSIYDQSGKLITSLAQEGLIRT